MQVRFGSSYFALDGQYETHWLKLLFLNTISVEEHESAQVKKMSVYCENFENWQWASPDVSQTVFPLACVAFLKLQVARQL